MGRLWTTALPYKGSCEGLLLGTLASLGTYHPAVTLRASSYGDAFATSAGSPESTLAATAVGAIDVQEKNENPLAGAPLD